MLALYFFVLDICKILRGTLPVRGKDEALIVFSLGENAGPGL